MTDVTFGASGYWLGTRTGAGGTATLAVAHVIHEQHVYSGELFHDMCGLRVSVCFVHVLPCAVFRGCSGTLLATGQARSSHFYPYSCNLFVQLKLSSL